MPMSDPPVGPGPDEAGGDERETLERLRLAEANIESLQDVRLSQESLADKLTTALQASAQSQQELARVQQELAVAVRSAGWRGVARAGKRRAVRLLAARRTAVQPVAPVPPVADAVGRVRPKMSHGPTFATRTGSTSTTRWTTRRGAP